MPNAEKDAARRGDWLAGYVAGLRDGSLVDDATVDRIIARIMTRDDYRDIDVTRVIPPGTGDTP